MELSLHQLVLTRVLSYGPQKPDSIEYLKRFRATLKGHVGAVYQVCWSPDSRMIVSSSRDSTCKVYELRNNKLREDLPGHADEVFAVDWSPAGSHVASGGKDCALKM